MTWANSKMSRAMWRNDSNDSKSENDHRRTLLLTKTNAANSIAKTTCQSSENIRMMRCSTTNNDFL